MSAQHTPGPWEVAVHYLRTRFDGKSGGWCLATVDTVTDEHEANARLIAAAPELLRVAQDLSEVLAEKGMLCECGEEDCLTTRLRKAIAKATGEQA